jgi:hypothetical protein
LLLASVIPIAVIGGLITRFCASTETTEDNKVVKSRGKGIGWQFIRYTVLVIGLPLAAVLAINGLLTSELATLISGALGYAFGKSSDK